jgi:hypothetical protein
VHCTTLPTFIKRAFKDLDSSKIKMLEDYYHDNNYIRVNDDAACTTEIMMLIGLVGLRTESVEVACSRSRR